MKRKIIFTTIVVLLVCLCFALSACNGVKRGGKCVYVASVTRNENNEILFDRTYGSFSGEQWCEFILPADKMVKVQATSSEGALSLALTTDADYSKGEFYRTAEPGKDVGFVFATHGKRTTCRLTLTSEGTRGSIYAVICDKTDGTEEGVTDLA